MVISVVKSGFRLNTDFKKGDLPSASLRIAICPPELILLVKVIRGESTEATYIIQNYVAEGLKARGYEITFIAPMYSMEEIVCTNDLLKPNPAPLTWSDSHWFKIASRSSWYIQRRLGVPYLNLFANYRLYDACLQCLPGHDIVYERNGMYKSGVAMACKRLKIPYVLYFEADDILEHDYMDKPITGLLRRRARATAQFNLDAADCVICVSEAGKANLIENWGVQADKIVVFPNAVDIHRFSPDEEARSEVRASLAIGNHPLIIFVGSFYKWHDVATLLDAFGQVLTSHPEARLILVGEGEQRQAMAQRASELGIENAVHFTGQVPHGEVPRLMAAADIAVVPYPPMDHELWLSPLKLFEYMASGVAVVTSELGQISEVIQNDRNGLLVPAGNAFAIREALIKLIEDDVLRFHLGKQARVDAVHQYSWENYISRLERLISVVIDNEPIEQI